MTTPKSADYVPVDNSRPTDENAGYVPCPSRSPDGGYACEHVDTREAHGGGHEHWAGFNHLVVWGVDHRDWNRWGPA